MDWEHTWEHHCGSVAFCIFRTYMKREFVINAVLLLVSNLLIKVYFLLGIDRNFQLALGAEEYGLYYSLFNLTLVFQFVNDFGLQNFANRYVSQNQESSLNKFQTFAGMKVILSVLYLFLLFCVCYFGQYSFGMWPLILHIGFNQILVSAIFFNRAGISGLGYYRQDSFYSVLDRFILILIGSAVLWIPALQSWLSVAGFVWMQTLSLVTTWGLSYLFLQKKGIHFRFNIENLDTYKRLLVSTLPFVGIYLFGTLYNKLDVVLLHRLHVDGAQQAGIYASSVRIFEAASMISLAIGGLLLAMFSKLHDQPEKLSGLFKLSVKWLMVGTILVSCLGYFYAEVWVNLLYKTKDPVWVQTFAWIMLAFIPASINYILGAFYQAVHQEWKLVKFYFFAALLSMAGNSYAIPLYGVQATAILAIWVHGILFLVQAFAIWRTKSVIITKDFILFSILFFVIAAAVSWGVVQLALDWKIKMILNFIAIISVAFMFRMISLVEMREHKE